MAVTTWTQKLYNLNGTDKTFTDSEVGGTTNIVRYATKRVFSDVLNGLDVLQGTVYLDDNASAQITRKNTIIKLWRDVSDPDNGKSYTCPAGTPTFAGPIVATKKNAKANTLDFIAMSPLWRLQTHFHIENHHLVTDFSVGASVNAPYTGGNKDDLVWDHSALMWRLIDLINGAFGASSFTGIVKPTGSAPFWTKTINVSPYYVAKGSWTWSNIFEDLMKRAGGADLAPEYIHTASSPNLMYFKTDPSRGSDLSASAIFEYGTGAFNLEDISEDAQMVPGKFGNYVWVVGDGGPNAYVATAQDSSDITANGIYMVRVDVSGAKKFDVDMLSSPELSRAKASDRPIYSIVTSPTKPPYYKTDFVTGDVIKLNATKGVGLAITNLKQRIYTTTLAMSDNNVETATLEISHDFVSKVAAT